MFTAASRWNSSSTFSVPSSKKETAPTWIPIIFSLAAASACTGPGIEAVTAAAAALCKKALRSILTICPLLSVSVGIPLWKAEQAGGVFFRHAVDLGRCNSLLLESFE